MFSAKKFLCATTALVLAAPMAQAAGFQLKEQSASMQGLSFAGATAKADDISVMYYNPAAITRMSGTQAYGAASLIKPRVNFDIDTSNFTAAVVPSATAHTAADGDGGDGGSLAAVPALYAMTSLDNGLKVGFAINTPFGLTTEYDEDWVGRYHAIKSELITINFAPTVAWKYNDQWSFGASANIQYAEANLTNAFRPNNVAVPDGLTDLKGDDIGYGFRLGALYEPTDKTRVGIAYHSGIHHKLEGDVKNTINGALQSQINAQAKLRTPDIASIGIYHDLNDQWAVMGDLAWTNWSTFENLIVTNRDTGAELSNIEENWEDSYFAAVGFEYHPCNCDHKTWQFGVAYDQAAVDDQHRTFRIPDTDRYWLSAGYQHEWENKTFNIGFTHIIVDDMTIEEDHLSTQKGVVAGDISGDVNILSASLNWKF